MVKGLVKTSFGLHFGRRCSIGHWRLPPSPQRPTPHRRLLTINQRKDPNLTRPDTQHQRLMKITAKGKSCWSLVLSAAIVAVLSLVLNYSSTLRTQRDSQFLEALKRFGDKDSSRVRSSAAGLLAKLSQQKGSFFRWQRPNFSIVFDQLMTGLRLEDNSVCLGAIMDAFQGTPRT